MDLKKRKESKKFKVKRFFLSVKYSIDGLIYAYGNEQSVVMHGVGTILIILIGIFLKISFYEWAVLIIADLVVLAVELLNTGIEATVDLITDEIHPLAKIAKDCGSAAGFVTGILLVIICLVIFIPYIKVLMGL